MDRGSEVRGEVGVAVWARSVRSIQRIVEHRVSNVTQKAAAAGTSKPPPHSRTATSTFRERRAINIKIFATMVRIFAHATGYARQRLYSVEAAK